MGRGLLIGREEECRRLDRCLEQEEAQLIIVYGRRRVGKTYLINQYFDNRFDFKLTGEYKSSKENQLENFTLELNRRSGITYDIPKSWKAAFDLLRTYLLSLPQKEKHIVFFDEMPWMDTPKSSFISAFEYFWNDFGSSQNGLVFIVCGSATAWMEENIDYNKGGLFNRKTCGLHLQPFRLNETEAYLQKKGIYWSRYDITECYMILGGIPYYLSFLDSSLSMSENIDQLFFAKSAELADEFDNLYRTLFSDSEDYISIVLALSKKRSGLSKSEIAADTGLSLNGLLSKRLNNLVSSGFVRANSYFNQRAKDTQYQLSDYYTMFYLKFVKAHYGRDEHFWNNTYDNPSRNAWAGFIFEQVCKDHLAQIKQRLGISGVLSQVSTWYTKPKGTGEKSLNGAQIDIVIDRRDHTITLCEVKFSVREFEIDKAYDLVLRNKLEAFKTATKTTKTLQLVMITTYGVKKNSYSGIARSQITLDDLFAKAY